MRRVSLLFAFAIVLGCKSPLGANGGGGTSGGGGGGGGSGAIGSSPGGAADGSVHPTSECHLSLDKSTIKLGALDVGTTGVGTVTLTDVGDVGECTVGALTITASPGLTATGCNGPLSGGESCLITITATPTSSGVFSGTVSIAASPGAVTPLVVSVIATEDDGLLFSVSPTVIDLGNILVGVAAPEQVITITAGTPFADLVISTSGPDVSVDKFHNTCTSVLVPPASCRVGVDFLATTTGAKSEAIIITAGGEAGKTVIVPITANVQSPAKLVVSPSTPQSLLCSSTAPSPLKFGVANSGDVPTGTITAEIKGPAADALEIANNTCSVLAPLAGCEISVICTRFPDYGDPTQATLVVADTGVGGSSVAVSLSNAGLGGPDALTILPATSDLGSAVVGETGASISFTVVKRTYGETGSLRVSVSNIEFVITYDTCSGVSLDRDGSCTFSVALKPVTAGVKTAVVTVTGEVGFPGQRTLTGTALEPDPPLDGGSG